ncbi:MAG: DUF885 family protein [Acidobacteria bacterium]|nr:DUF885 family protein [Acidobacteriota bacterium]
MRQPSTRRRFAARVTSGIVATLLLSAALPPAARAAEPNGAGSHADLVSLFREFLEWRTPPAAEGVVDYSPTAVAARRAEMERFQTRLLDMGVARWERAQKVDYLAVRAHFDEEEFILTVTRPWARDPVFYTDPLLRTAFTDLPARGEALAALQQRLRAIPKILEQARQHLTEVAGDYADLAIFNLSTDDGVNAGHPYREVPPAGVIGWYEDLLARASAQPELKADISGALQAVRGFHDWLVANRSRMTAENGVGKAALDWYLKHVKMIPLTSDEVLLLAQREFDRLWSFYAIERHRNRRLPEIALPTSREEYHRRLAETDARIRKFLVEEQFITIPDYIPTDWQEMGFNVPWIERKNPPNFWEQVQYRDPTPDHLHAVIPGHRFDTRVEQHLAHPIRQVSFGDRREGWAVYLEEAALQAGLLDDLPRTRELIYVFGLWRAARTIGDVRNQWNEWNVAQTHEYWQREVPWLDEFVARRYSYLRPTPATSLHYTMGAIQMSRLLADRRRQLGDAFVLGRFHDEFMSKGRIPIALIRYEMTGDETDVREFWKRTRLADLKR